MNRDTDNNEFAGIGTLDRITENAVQSFGRVIHSATIYGMRHRATVDSMSNAYDLTSAVVESSNRINFTLKNGALLINGRLPDSGNALIKQLLRKMRAKDITAFSIVRGVSSAEFEKLIELLSSAGNGDFEAQLKSSSLRHVSSEKVQYQEVVDGQEAGAGSSRGEGSSDIRDLAEEWLSGGRDRDADSAQSGSSGDGASAGVEQIVAFLKGNVSPDSPEPQEELARAAEDPEKLAQLIMDAAAIRQSQSNLQSGESMADLVIGCLRRSYEGLKKSSKAKERNGKIELKKSFMLLEKNIIDKLHRLMGPTDESADSKIRAAIEEMGDELELDHIADEYMEQRAMLQRNEKKIGEYIRGQKGGSLERRMLDAGMAPESWRSLVASSRNRAEGSAADGGSGGDAGGSFGALAVVLAKFDEFMSSTTPNASEVENFLDQIESHVGDSEQNTHRKIDDLNEDIQQHIEGGEIGMGDAEKRQIRAHREQFSIFVERLAELAQELLQPLTVINCTINMVNSGYIGEISDEQKDLLALGQSNANRLNRLIDHLTKLVGYPKELKPKIVEADIFVSGEDDKDHDKDNVPDLCPDIDKDRDKEHDKDIDHTCSIS